MTVGCATGECRAGFMFLGPTPYRSAADSPFPVGGTNASFHLEDFEDGELNTPGIFQPLHPVLGTAFHGVVLGPSEFTDSVDGDDGIVNGSGTTGHSLRSRAFFYSQTIPQRNTGELKFEFDQAALGYLPNAFGFVWTDGPAGIDSFREGLELRMVINHSTANEFLSPYVKPMVNVQHNGQTLEDFFVGVTTSAPIADVTIFGVYYGDSERMRYLEIDHLQYGRLAVPEPETYWQTMWLFAMVAIWKLISCSQNNRCSQARL